MHPRGIGHRYGDPGPMPDVDLRSLTSDEITRIGHALYNLVRSFFGYRAAIVGWDPEALVDVEEVAAWPRVERLRARLPVAALLRIEEPLGTPVSDPWLAYEDGNTGD